MIRPVSLAAVLVLACAAPKPRPAVKLPPVTGAPLDVSAEDLDGSPARIAGGGQVVVVDFFATWCQPCKVQLPHLERLARELQGRGLAVYAVSFDEDPMEVRGFAALMQVDFPVLLDRGGAKLSAALSIERLPTTFIADRRGIIRYVHVGYDDREGERIEREIRELLDEKG